MKTIRQVADELGISKDKVKYRVKFLPTDFLEKRENITYITPDGIELLASWLGNSLGKLPDLPRELPTDFTRNYPLYPPDETAQIKIQALESEIERLNWQLDFERTSFEERIILQDTRLQEAISDKDKLHVLLEREQQLRIAGTIQAQLGDGSKRGFFSRIFGNRENKRQGE